MKDGWDTRRNECFFPFLRCSPERRYFPPPLADNICLNVGLSGPLPPAVPSRLPFRFTSNLIIIIMLHHLAKERRQESKTEEGRESSLGIPSLVLICGTCKERKHLSVSFWSSSFLGSVHVYSLLLYPFDTAFFCMGASAAKGKAPPCNPVDVSAM